MPAGVEVVVENGFATIDFVDKTLRGPGLAKLLAIGTPPDAIEKLTREGPRAVYVVPEGNAREAGLLDEADSPQFAGGGMLPPLDDSHGVEFVDPGGDGVEKVGIEGRPDGSFTELVTEGNGEPLPDIAPSDEPKAWPDGDPEMDWTRDELNAYAASKGIDAHELPNKQTVLDAIADVAAQA